MPRNFRILLSVSVVVTLVVLIAIGGLLWASKRVPPFYSSAMAQDSTAVRHASDAMLRQTAALVSDINRDHPWQALFTEEQINGWLAFDAQRNHSNLFPPEVRDPRVSIDEDRVRIGFRWQDGLWSSVVSMELEVYLRDTNVIAVRLQHVRAGLLPLPLGQFLDHVVTSAENFGLHVEQRQIDGDPLLVITLPTPKSRRQALPALESLELHKGEIFVAGTTGASRGNVPAVASRQRSRSRRSQSSGRQEVSADGENEKVQR